MSGVAECERGSHRSLGLILPTSPCYTFAREGGHLAKGCGFPTAHPLLSEAQGSVVQIQLRFRSELHSAGFSHAHSATTLLYNTSILLLKRHVKRVSV